MVCKNLKTFASILFLTLSLVGILGCQVNEEAEFKERTSSAGKYSMQGGFEAENERALLMEADLARRHRFFQATKGTYEGRFQTEAGLFNIRVTLIPSLPPYPKDSNRIRTEKEVESDLMSLHFRVRMLQWNPQNPLSAVSCQDEMHPDMNRGEIEINCENRYKLLFSDASSIKALKDLELLDENQEKEQAVVMAQAVLEGKLETILQLHGLVEPGTNASRYEFLVNRITQ